MGYLWVLACARSSVISTYPTSKIKYLLALKKPPIYLRYVDNILILANNINEINILQDTFQKIQFLTLLLN